MLVAQDVQENPLSHDKSEKLPVDENIPSQAPDGTPGDGGENQTARCTRHAAAAILTVRVVFSQDHFAISCFLYGCCDGVFGFQQLRGCYSGRAMHAVPVVTRVRVCRTQGGKLSKEI